MDDCLHEMAAGTCGICLPKSRAARVQYEGPYVTIQPGELYHLAGCREVNWDPATARNPGKRLELSATEVRSWLSDGRLKRGCRKCEANATAAFRPT